MTLSLLVFIPVALFGLIAAACFVGCAQIAGFQDFEYDPPPNVYTNYSAGDVVSNVHCVAYWPLNDTADPDKTKRSRALDVVGTKNNDAHNGQYANMFTDPTLFSCPASTTPPSAYALGEQTIGGAAGIVPGDRVDPSDPASAQTTATSVNGGFVTVAPNGVTNPAAPFSVEMWVQPGWTQMDQMDQPARRTLIDSRDQPPATPDQVSGFNIWVNEDGFWEATLGIPGTPAFLPVTATTEADLTGKSSHIVLIHNGVDAQLYVNGVRANMPVAAAGFVPNTTKPLTIGVGLSRVEDRPKIPEPAFPFFPFAGTIQCVAIYDIDLDEMTIINHWKHGKGELTD